MAEHVIFFYNARSSHSFNSFKAAYFAKCRQVHLLHDSKFTVTIGHVFYVADLIDPHFFTNMCKAINNEKLGQILFDIFI